MTNIPKRLMDAAYARHTVQRLLDRMAEWRAYAAEPVTDQQHAQDKLAALAQVMQATIRDVVGKWDNHMINGYPEEAYENDSMPPMIHPRFVERDVHRARKRGSDAV